MAEFPRCPVRLVVYSDQTQAHPETMLADFARLAERASPGRVRFMLRDYQLSVARRWRLAEQLFELAAHTGQEFGVAERADLARAWACTAFHVPEAGLRPADARAYLGPHVFLSRACHDVRELPALELDGAVLSPIFAARKGRPALGVPALEQARQAWGARPALIALGGVDASNAGACLAAGADAVAVIGAARLPDPEPLLRALGSLRP